jgi:predicted Zn-dependent protease
MTAPVSNKRLAFLEKAVVDKSGDPFAWYGLAVEYGNVGRHDDSLRTFTTLRGSHPDYVPMYLACGQMLQTAGRTAEAREWFEAGMAATTKAGNSHARATLESALASLG